MCNDPTRLWFESHMADLHQLRQLELLAAGLAIDHLGKKLFWFALDDLRLFSIVRLVV
jgi:hypothetical protein